MPGTCRLTPFPPHISSSLFNVRQAGIVWAALNHVAQPRLKTVTFVLQIENICNTNVTVVDAPSGADSIVLPTCKCSLKKESALKNRMVDTSASIGISNTDLFLKRQKKEAQVQSDFFFTILSSSDSRVSFPGRSRVHVKRCIASCLQGISKQSLFLSFVIILSFERFIIFYTTCAGVLINLPGA